MSAEAIVAGVIGSLIASLVFWGYFFFLRPHVQIAGVISKGADLDGGEVYFIKFVNQGRCALTDVSCELAVAREEVAGNSGGKILRRHVIALRNPEFRYLAGRPFRSEVDVAQNAKRLVFDKQSLKDVKVPGGIGDGITPEGIVGTDGFFLELRVFARHGISGHARLAKMRYCTADAITLKPYKPGTTLELEE